ncbi:WD40-repeat-containing domain protein [Mycena floridula]|nr:WD40-repeat-containing domain protein [Mycena floridula]
MSSTKKAKKSPQKASKSRPAATSAISHPVVQDSSSLTALSAFSPSGRFFGYLSLAVDKHRLRIYDTVDGKSIADHVLDSARVTALNWGDLTVSVDQTEQPSRKKRKKAENQEEMLILGLSDGSIRFMSPTHGRVVHTLSHSTCSAAIISAVSAQQSLWTSGADNNVRLWNVSSNELVGTWKIDDRTPYSSLAFRPMDTEDEPQILVANHSIHLFSTNPQLSQKPTELASFTGHASSIKQLQWDASQKPATRFVSMAEADRIISIWETPDESAVEGKMVASVQLDSDARSITLHSTTQKQTLLTLAASGKVSIFPIPSELLPPASFSRTQHKISTVLPRSTLAVAPQKGGTTPHVVAASFVHGEDGRIRIARIVAGIKPVFDVVSYLDESGDFITNVTIDDVKIDAIEETQPAAPNKRYAENPSVAVASGVELGQDEDMDELVAQNVEGDLDVEIAELSLGQRLTAISGVAAEADSDGEEDSSRPKKEKSGLVAPTASLTRTLIQALHSSDSKLLETCLAHSDQALIGNTVKRLPPQLAVPLITACVERLGRGARGGNMKGGGGGASSQRGTTLITWIKTVLAIHSAHLMTMPDLVARLSGLHATLTTRIALQESLLSLSGRLDMVLSQIEMRSSAAPAPLVPRPAPKSKGKVSRYVEGESEDEDEQMDVEVEAEDADDAASIEDVEFGGGSSEDDAEDSEEEDEDSEEDDEDSEGPDMNGFIDDEAEEEYTDEDEDESE